MGAHGLRPLRVGNINGALFGTLADDAEPLEDYLGAPILAQLRRLFDRPVRVLGYNRQRIRGNWKLYAENTRDNYHASLLHEFLVTFGLDRSTQIGGVKMDARHRHNITWAEAESDTDEFAHEAYAGAAGAQRLPVAEGAGARRLPPRARRQAESSRSPRFSRPRSLSRSATAWRCARSGRAASTRSRSSRRCSATRTIRPR